MTSNKFLDKPFVQYAIFILISVIYFYGICHFFNIHLEKLKTLDPNSLGDFLAGTFAPLGFILLILGYLQNTRALKMQGDELRVSNEELANNVEQQRLLVQAAKEDIELAKKQFFKGSNKEVIQSQPFIHLAITTIDKDIPDKFLVSDPRGLDDSEFSRLKVLFSISNSRAIARETTINIKMNQHLINQRDLDVFSSDKAAESIGVSFKYPTVFKENNSIKLDLEFHYLDEMDISQFQYFQVIITRNKEGIRQKYEIIRGETSYKDTLIELN